ncbi:MAG: ATP-binding protein [Balneolales bacterium]|nr:ATP-binding protein [Balneolales bacterium]
MIEYLSKIERFNFWKSIPELGVSRKRYLSRLKKYQNSRLVKVLTGQRRVGKSYLMRQLIADLINEGVDSEHTLYLNMEFSEYNFIQSADDLLLFVHEYFDRFEKNTTGYVFIDEIQNIESWEKAVNALSQDYTRDIRICITGSNAQLLSGELATFLSGRYISFLITAFTFDEFLAVRKTNAGKTEFINYLQNGGLPELFRLPDEESRRYYVSAVYDTVILRDIVERHQIRDVSLLKDIFAFLANNVGNLLSVNSLVGYFKKQNRKTNYETVAQYIGYLENSFIIHKCERFQIKGKEVLSGSMKYYLNDLSFKNFIYPGVHLGWGNLMENLVFLELISRGYKVYTGQLRGKEIDFVAQKGEDIRYIQVAWQLSEESTRDREYAPLLSLKDAYPKCILSADDIALPNNQGIRNILYWNEWAE